MQLTDHDRVGGYGSRAMTSSSSGDYLRTSNTTMTVRRGGAVPAASDFNVSYQGGHGDGNGGRRRYDWELYGDEDGRIIGNSARRQARRRPVSCRGMRWTGPSSSSMDTTTKTSGHRSTATASSSFQYETTGSSGITQPPSLPSLRYGNWTTAPTSISSSVQGVQVKDQMAIRGPSTVQPNPDKLDLMAENSSLKVKLAKAEKNLKDSEDRLTHAQRQISDLQGRLNDRTIELTDLRNRFAGNTSTSSYNQSQLEIEKLKCAVESLLTTSEEKDRRICELQVLLKKYSKLEALMSGSKILEQIGLDGETLSVTASLSRKSSPSHYGHVDRWNHDDIDGQIHDPLKPSMPHPSATSTPVNLHTVGTVGSDVMNGGSLQRNSNAVQSGSKSPSSSTTSPPSTIALSPSPDRNSGSLSYEDTAVNTMTQTSTLPSAKVRTTESFVKQDQEDETLKDELAQEYRLLQTQQMQSQPASTDVLFRKKPSTRGLKKFFGKLKRSNSQDFDDKSEPFTRNALRSTAGGRLGWSKEMNDIEMPFARWDADRIALWLHVIGLSAYVGNCKRWGRNGEQLLQASTHDLEKELGIRNYYHRKKLQLALESIASSTQSPSANLDHNWVTRWLDDVGLPQYKDMFTEARIDGRMLHCMTVDDLVGLKVTNTLHHLSIRRGIEVLRLNSFNPVCLKRRPSPEEGVLQNCPSEVMLWTNHRVMEWLRSIDLSEYAPNLRGSGVHGALMVLEPRFGADVFATLLSIPSTKTLLRRHLSTHFVTLIGNAVQQQKRELEAIPGYLPLTLGQKVKVKKSIFKIGRSDGKEDLVCPMDFNSENSRNRTNQNNSSVIANQNADIMLQEKDELDSD